MTEPVTPDGRTAADDRALMIVLAYLWILAFVPLLTHKADADLQWHAKQGLILTLVEIVAFVAWWVLLSLLWIMTGALFTGCVVALQLIVIPVVGLAVIGLHAWAIYKASKGQRLLVPMISAYASRL